MPAHHEFDEFVARAFARLPQRMRRAIEWLRHPARRWVRLPAALFLLIGGVFWFLPVLGFWMLPLGLILLAEDIPPLKRHVAAGLTRIERWWKGRRHPID